MTFYLVLILVLLALAILAFMAEWSVIKIAYKKQLFDKPNERKIHSAKIPRLGGIVVLPLILIGLFLLWIFDARFYNLLFSHYKLELLGIISSLSIVYLSGIIDDLIGIRYRNKFVAQIFSGIALCSCGILIDNLHGFMGIGQLPEAVAWGLTILTVIYVSNAFNFIDGIDGLAGSLSLIALGCYSVQFKCLGLSGMAIICGFVMIALLALLSFNIFGKPEKSKVFMGDAGSLTLGVFLCVCGIITIRNAASGDFAASNPFIVATIPLALPCFDVVRVVVYRMSHGRNIFKADKSHIHHKLLALGHKQPMILGILLSIDIFLIAVAYLLVPVLGVNMIMMIEIVLFTLVIQVINRKLKQNEI